MWPFGDELFVASATRLSFALAGGLSLVVAAERHHLRELPKRTLFLRWRTWALTAPLYGLAALGPGVCALVFVCALALQGVREFGALTGLPVVYRRILYSAGLTLPGLAFLRPGAAIGLLPMMLLVATAPALVAQDVRDGVRHVTNTLLGTVYIPMLLAHFLLLKSHPLAGPGLLIALGTAVALSDVAAFCFGSAFGRHRLAPHLSPNKTWEGVAGNLVGAYAGFGLMSFALPDALPLAMAWALPAVIALACVWGDLIESLIKRHFGVKDAGSCLPGFGGLLDRVDSLLVALPLTYALLAVVR